MSGASNASGGANLSDGAWSTGIAAAALFLIALMLALLGGCAGRVSLFPNSDPALRKTPPEFAADASRRFPYKADAPRAGEANGRVSVDYTGDMLHVVNLSEQDWDNVEVWVNKTYVVFVPKIEKGTKQLKALDFQMLFNDTGVSFPTNNLPAENQVHEVEILRDGKWYTLRTQLAD